MEESFLKEVRALFRSLHMKLVLIMMLLITSLMAVVGTFLMTNVSGFYIDAFYQQMNEAFGENSADFVNSLRSEAAQEDGVERLENMLSATSGTLGIDYMMHIMYPELMTDQELEQRVDEFYQLSYGKTFEREYLGY